MVIGIRVAFNRHIARSADELCQIGCLKYSIIQDDVIQPPLKEFLPHQTGLPSQRGYC